MGYAHSAYSSYGRYGRRTAPGRKRPGRVRRIILTVVVVIIAAILIGAWMVFSDPNAGKGLDHVAPSNQLAATVGQSAISGKECSFTKDEVNSYLAYVFQKSGLGKEKNGIQVHAIAVAAASGNNADLYLPLTYRGMKYAVTMNITPSLQPSGGHYLLQINSVHVGRMPVPLSWVTNRVRAKLPKGYSISDDTIVCPMPSVKESTLNVTVSVKMNSFHIENGLLKIGVTADVHLQ